MQRERVAEVDDVIGDGPALWVFVADPLFAVAKAAWAHADDTPLH
jgi:hypothetical protein